MGKDEKITSLSQYFMELDSKEEKREKKERLERAINELNEELLTITTMAYQTAIGKVVDAYQEKLNDPDLTKEEREAIEQERMNFEADPSTKGVTRENSPIVDEDDKRRALQIVEQLKDTSKIKFPEDGMTESEFVEYMKGFASRNGAKE